VCGGGVCVGGGGRAFYYTYIYSQKGRSCEVAELVGVLVAETGLMQLRLDKKQLLQPP
jgi:hypothetical protein